MAKHGQWASSAGFSTMTNINVKKLNPLTNEHLENLMRAVVTEYQPQVEKITSTIQSKISAG